MISEHDRQILSRLPSWNPAGDMVAQRRAWEELAVVYNQDLPAIGALEENVELPLRLAEVDRHDRESRVAEALARVRLGTRRRHRPSELSGGEQQRGALARALVNRPAILFADEPTGNLDSVNGEQILLLLREFQDSLGMTIIMVTHERPLAQKFANRIALLSDGRLVSDGAQR